MAPKFRIMHWYQRPNKGLLTLPLIYDGWRYLIDPNSEEVVEFETFEQACDKVNELIQEEFTAEELIIVRYYPFRTEVLPGR